MRLVFRLPGGSFFEQLTPPGLLPPFLKSQDNDDRPATPSAARPSVPTPSQAQSQIAQIPTLLTAGAPSRGGGLNDRIRRPKALGRRDLIGELGGDNLNFR